MLKGTIAVEYNGRLYDFSVDITDNQLNSLADEVLKEHVDMLRMYEYLQEDERGEPRTYFNDDGTPYLLEEFIDTCGIIDIENYNSVLFLGCPEILRRICFEIKNKMQDMFARVREDFNEAYKSEMTLARTFDEPFDNIEDIFMTSSILEIKHIPYEVFALAREKVIKE